MSNSKVAFLGTGLMGYPMAGHIAQAGYPLSAWNRTKAKAKGLAGYGATIAETPEAAVTGAQIIVSMLTDGSAVAEMVQRLTTANSLSTGAVWVDMSSTRPDEAKAAAEALSSIAVDFLDAPVSGGTKGAENATLAIMVGGAEDVLEKVRPVLECMGRAKRTGPVGSGQLAKLANQAIVGITISAVAEAMLLVEQRGADPAAVREALKGGFADSPILQLHGWRMSERDFTPGGPSRIQLKDLNNILAEAAAGGLSLPTAESVRDRYQRLVEELGQGDSDHAALFVELLDRNGL